jgi:hypothetical protein
VSDRRAGTGAGSGATIMVPPRVRRSVTDTVLYSDAGGTPALPACLCGRDARAPSPGMRLCRRDARAPSPGAPLRTRRLRSQPAAPAGGTPALPTQERRCGRDVRAPSPGARRCGRDARTPNPGARRCGRDARTPNPGAPLRAGRSRFQSRAN